jgi:large subunit ribosomal protein L19
MSQQIIALTEKKYKVARPDVSIGDTVVVDTVIRDGEKKRIQKFKGIVIAIKGKGLSKTFTVRKISYGIGVEKILPLYSPNVEAIEIIKHAKVRRSKLYFLRDRVGKRATNLRKGKDVTDASNDLIEVEEGSPESVDDLRPEDVAVQEEEVNDTTEVSNQETETPQESSDSEEVKA